MGLDLEITQETKLQFNFDPQKHALFYVFVYKVAMYTLGK